MTAMAFLFERVFEDLVKLIQHSMLEKSTLFHLWPKKKRRIKKEKPFGNFRTLIKLQIVFEINMKAAF